MYLQGYARPNRRIKVSLAGILLATLFVIDHYPASDDLIRRPETDRCSPTSSSRRILSSAPKFSWTPIWGTMPRKEGVHEATHTAERDDEIARLRVKVGELTMDNELLRERSRRAEATDPFGPRRSRK